MSKGNGELGTKIADNGDGTADVTITVPSTFKQAMPGNMKQGDRERLLINDLLIRAGEALRKAREGNANSDAELDKQLEEAKSSHELAKKFRPAADDSIRALAVVKRGEDKAKG